MKIRTLAVLIVVLVIAAFCCAGCLQELPLGDKYINEAVGLLRVQNTSTEKSYVIIAVELRNSAGEVIKTWEGLGQDGQGLRQGETWTGDLDLEGSFILYCTVQNTKEGTTGTFSHGAVEIKLHEVADSGITGEVYLSTTDTDKDGFSDFWETENKFNPNDPADGGTVYVSASAEEETGLGTKAKPYKSLAKGVQKAKSGLSDAARTVVAAGIFGSGTETAGASGTSLIHIDDTGLYGITIIGEDTKSAINVDGKRENPKRAIYLGPGTKLTLKSITILNGWLARGGGVYADGADLILGDGAVIQGCTEGGGVYAENGATVLMESGSLIGDDDVDDDVSKWNQNASGAGITLSNGSSLTMKGGSSIRGNNTNLCGAVYATLGSLVTLEDGAEITGNAPFNRKTMDSFGQGGGVRLAGKSKMLMAGGLIAGNINKKGGGGGVYVGGESELDMRGGTISGNTAYDAKILETFAKGNGGGVYVGADSVFNMSGGIIAGNTAGFRKDGDDTLTDYTERGRGGGVYVDGGKFFKTGGTVYGSDDSGNRNTAGDGTAGNGHAFFATDPARPADKTLPASFTL